MRTCPNCGHENQDDDRFCSNCGARLTRNAPPEEDVQPETPEPTPVPEETPTPEEAPAPTSPDPSEIPPQFAPPAGGPRNEWELTDREPADENWTMSSLGPPPKRPRRTWLWIIVGILAVFVLACCIFFFWVSATESGSDWLNNIATEVSIQATEQAQ